MKPACVVCFLGLSAFLCVASPSAEAQKRFGKPESSSPPVVRKRAPTKDRRALRPGAPTSSKKSVSTSVVAREDAAPELVRYGADGVRYRFLGYVGDGAGEPAKLWGSETPPGKSPHPYKYLGKMQFDSEWLHVWMETRATATLSPDADSAASAKKDAPPNEAGEPLSDEELSVVNAIPQEVEGVPEDAESPDPAKSPEKVPSSAGAGRRRIVILPPDPPITHNGSDPNLTPIAPNPAPKRP